MNEKHIILVSEMTKNYGTIRALDGVSLKIDRGIFGIIGPNGAGKTTFLKVLLGLVKLDGGSGEVLGHDIQHDSLKIRQSVGVLHERPSYPSQMTVQAYLSRVERLYNIRGNTERVLSMVNLSDASDRRIKTLSAGMLQRLGVAQSLVGNPELVFLDEPSSNLDVDGRDAVSRMILDIHNETDVSFVIASHILSDIERVCHGVAILREGRVIEAGGVHETVQRYTAKRFRILTSDPKRLITTVRQVSGVLNSQISGANIITIRIDTENISEVETMVRKSAKRLGVQVYAIERADTLEDAFRELVRDEK